MPNCKIKKTVFLSALLSITTSLSSQAEVTYFLDNKAQIPPTVANKINNAMTNAVNIYNTYSNYDLDWKIRVVYNPKIPTANASFKGRIAFGKSISTKTALHEMGHIFGVGTHWKWGQLCQGNRWTGHNANELISLHNPGRSALSCDKKHFWPYGNNRKRESDKKHVTTMLALMKDLKIYSQFTQ